MNRKFSLKKNHEIEKLVKLHRSVGNKYYTIFFQNNKETKIVVSISKKLGKAHYRNYQKRVLKEILRKNISLLNNLKVLIVIKNKSTELDYLNKERELKNLLLKIRIK